MDLKIFEKLYKKDLKTSEAYEINSNLLGFINLLIEIDDEKNKDDRHNSSNDSKK